MNIAKTNHSKPFTTSSPPHPFHVTTALLVLKQYWISSQSRHLTGRAGDCFPLAPSPTNVTSSDGSSRRLLRCPIRPMESTRKANPELSLKVRMDEAHHPMESRKKSSFLCPLTSTSRLHRVVGSVTG